MPEGQDSAGRRAGKKNFTLGKGSRPVLRLIIQAPEVPSMSEVDG